MNGLTWLHLSDWHQRGPDFDRQVVRDALLDDLRGRASLDPRLDEVDFVVFSGDAAWSGQAKEFNTAREVFFDPILNTLKDGGLPPDKLFFVPGNHDLSRDHITEMLPPGLQKPLENDAEVQKWLTDPDKRDRALEPFRDYSAFVTGYTGQKPPAYANTWSGFIGQKTVGILCLNSAWMCGRNKDAKGEVNDYGQLVVGDPQLHEAVANIQGADVRIAVLHHPFAWLKEFDRERIEDRLKRACHFILHGHEHKPRAERARQDRAKARDERRLSPPGSRSERDLFGDGSSTRLTTRHRVVGWRPSQARALPAPPCLLTAPGNAADHVRIHNPENRIMALFYALGDALVSNDELRAMAACGKLQQFQQQIFNGSKTARLDFKFGTATAKNLAAPKTPSTGGIIQPRTIGIGKPLTVQLRHVYTGNQATGFWGNKDMLVVSAMKSVATYDAAPRAINYLLRKATNNRNLRTPDATDAGTPLICYSPALAQTSSVVTVEVRFHGFPKETFDAVAQAFSRAAGLPLFAPANAYLVAASVVTKLAGSIGKSLTRGTPALKQTEEITLVTPGSMTAAAGFALMIANDVPESLLRDHQVNDRGQLVRVDDMQRAYDGPHCYAVISLDGRANTDFDQFTPVAASAAQLDRFYNLTDGSSQVLGQLVEGLKLYNDMTFREKAAKAKQRLQALEDQGVARTDPQYQEELAHYSAYVANIENQVLKPRNLPRGPRDTAHRALTPPLSHPMEEDARRASEGNPVIHPGVSSVSGRPKLRRPARRTPSTPAAGD